MSDIPQREHGTPLAPHCHLCAIAELWGMSYPHPYLELYNSSALAIKAVHPTLQVGGPATAGLAHVQDFIDDTKKLGLPVDFISTHSYPSDGYCSNTRDPDCFAKKVLAQKEIAEAAGYPFLLTVSFLSSRPPFCHVD